MNAMRSNNLSLKYKLFTVSACWDEGIRQLERIFGTVKQENLVGFFFEKENAIFEFERELVYVDLSILSIFQKAESKTKECANFKFEVKSSVK